jgi:hypothetical protein
LRETIVLMAVVGAFMIGCAGLLVVGCSSGVRSEVSPEEHGHAEATEGQARSPKGSSEQARCEGTRTFRREGFTEGKGGWFYRGTYTTNDVPGCPNGGPLSGTDGRKKLYGGDVLHGGRDADVLNGEEGDDVLYGGNGDDNRVSGDEGEDVIYGGDGDDFLFANDRQRDRVYCGEGRDKYLADKIDYVSSACEKKSRGVVT